MRNQIAVMELHMLDNLLAPKTVALVGVSSKSGVFQVGARAVFQHLLRHGYQDHIDIVTREPVVLEGVKSHTDIADLETVPDCMLISVPAAQVLDSVEKGLDLGCRAFVVITGGFAEAGEGELQRKLTSRIAEAGASLLGPNTTGYVNFGGIAMSSTSRISADLPPAGDVGLVVQSGALGSGLLEEAARGGIGLSYLISTGNEAVNGLPDFVEYLADDPQTRAIAIYAEAVRDSARLIAATRRAHAAGKPVVVYKAGRSDAGRRAAAGHTGALMGARGAYRAAVEQLGWIDVANIEDLLPVANYVARSGPAERVGVISVSGGYGGCVADALEESGVVRLPTPGQQTVEKMRGDVPAFLSASNPVDVGGTPFRRDGGFATCLDAFADDPDFDAIVIANTPLVAPWGAAVAEAAIATHARTGKPISAIWPSEIFNAEALATLRVARIPTFGRVETFTAAATGALHVARAKASPSKLLRDGQTGMPKDVPGEIVALDEAKSKARLRELGIPFPREDFVPVGGAVDPVAANIGYPITLKGIAKGVVHKSELGLVEVALPDEGALRDAVKAMQDSAERNALQLEGFLVGETVKPEAEVILGLGLDPEFGPVLTFGAGGILTEMMRDVAVRLLPLDQADIAAMVESCRVATVLKGARGKPPLDMDGLVSLIRQVADLAPHLGADFAGLEINPVGVGRSGVWPLDATVFTGRT
ncbi:hypothetical protein E0K89_000925 [Aquicoccus sp. SCR17]|nr:hypothetical protein [Carideicomes alvinocaridis]